MVEAGKALPGKSHEAGAYGEQRRFVGLESFIIQRRVKAADRALMRLITIKKAPQVLELGCGFHGANLRYLRKRFPEASFRGIDLRVDKSSAPDGVELIEANLTTWQPDVRYDCVLSLAVAEHFVDIPQHFRLVSQSLSDGGMAVVTTPKPEAHFVLSVASALGIFDRESIRDHKLYLTRSGIETLAGQAHLEVIEYHSILMLNQCCILVRG